MLDCDPVRGDNYGITPGLGWVWCDACDAWWPPTSVHATQIIPNQETR